MPQLPLGKKLSYASGGVAMNLTNLVISQWLFLLYASGGDQALVPPALFGLFFMLGRVTDAVTDPLIGYWSDNARYRLGRRIPFIRYGVLPFALVFFLLWTPPIDGPHWFNAVYVICLIQLYFILYTVVTTPYISLLPELTTDLKERINVSTLQAAFVMVGTVVFGVMGVILERWGWAAIGAVVALVTLASYTPTAFGIRERYQRTESAAAPVGLWRWLLTTLRNRPFLFLVCATSLYWFGLNLMLMLAPFWVVELLGLKKDAVSMLMGPFLATNIVFFVIFNLLAKRFGKYILFLATLLGTAVALPLLLFVGQLPFGTPFSQSMVVFGVVGIPVAGFLMLPFAILADVVDYDEARTGARREAIFFGVQAIFQKSAIGFSVFAFGLLVNYGDTLASATELGLKAVSVVAGLACLIGFVVFLGYPIRDRGGEIVSERSADGGSGAS